MSYVNYVGFLINDFKSNIFFTIYKDGSDTPKI